MDEDEATSALKRAIESGEKAKEQCHQDGRITFYVLSSLAAWYCELMEHTQNLAWGNHVLAQLEALCTKDASRPTAIIVHSRLCEIQYRILKKRRMTISANEKLDLAISMAKEVVSKLDSDDRCIGQQYKRLADMQKNKFDDGYGSDTDLDDAKVYLEKAINTRNAYLSVRLPAAFDLAMMHLRDRDFAKAHTFLQQTISLLPLSRQHQIPLQDLRAMLRPISTYAEYAASVALEVGHPQHIALQSLESSRCIISRLSMRMKVDLGRLYKVDRRLAGQYQDVCREWRRESGNTNKSVFSPNKPFTDGLLHLHIVTMVALEDDIRQLEGFKNFQKPFSAKKMKELASQGPIIVINVSKLRSDAFIVAEDEIKLVNLPRLSYEELKLKTNLLEKLSNTTQRDIKGFDDESIPTDMDPAEILQWLWDEAVHEIMDSTPLQASKRIWWITSGIASRVPFHAAGDHSQGSTDNVFTRATSSYISSFAALSYARQQAIKAAALSPTNPLRDLRMLLVTVPKTPGYTNLETQHEVKAVEEIFSRLNTEGFKTSFTYPREGRLSILEAPSPDTVLYTLKECSFVHFACHGTNVELDSAKSGLVLVEKGVAKTLTVSQLETLPLHEFGEVGELAYLSACSTAQIRENNTLSDEAPHLGNALQALGYSNVIATLWRTNDQAAGEVARVFYKSLLAKQNGAVPSFDISKRLDAAGALRDATASYRDLHRGGEHALAWLPFIHIGA